MYQIEMLDPAYQNENENYNVIIAKGSCYNNLLKIITPILHSHKAGEAIINYLKSKKEYIPKLIENICGSFEVKDKVIYTIHCDGLYLALRYLKD